MCESESQEVHEANFKQQNISLGGGFKYFLFSPLPGEATQIFFIFTPNPGEDDPIWRSYFSDGLVTP